VSFDPRHFATLLAVAAIGCQGELEMQVEDEPGEGPGGSSGVIDQPGMTSPLNPDGPDPILPGKTRPDGTPIPGTDTCRPPRERLWQLSPQQLAWTLRSVYPYLTNKELEGRFALYSVQGEPFTADPAILNGSPQFTTEVFSAVRSLSQDAWEGLSMEGEPCSGLGARQCAEFVLDEHVPRMWSRPMQSEEREEYLAFFDTNAAEHGEDIAGVMVLRRMLMAPDVLFRSERGELDVETGIAHLTPHEIASVISFTLTDGSPDDELWAAAQDSSLSDPVVIEQQARRILDVQPSVDEVALENDQAVRQVRGLLRFFREWLDVERVRLSTVDLGRITGRRLRWLDNETMLFLRLSLWAKGGTLSEILSAEYSVYSNTLNDYYGWDQRDKGNETGDEVPTSGGRKGLLMHGGWLISHDTTSRRGEFIRARMFCQNIEVPADVDNNLDGVAEALEEEAGMDLHPREIRDRHMNDTNCSGCHALLDPLAYPFDAYGKDGLFREQWEGGFDIDVAGEITGTASTNGQVADVGEMVSTLSTSTDVEKCFVRQVFSYVHGRPPGAEDACYVERLEQQFSASGGDVRELVIQMVAGEEMRQRTPLFDAN